MDVFRIDGRRGACMSIVRAICCEVVAIVVAGDPVAAQTPSTAVDAVGYDTSERYLLAVFGAQSVPKHPSRSHTFGIAVRVGIAPEGCRVVGVDTISWMPQSMKLEVLRTRVEPGWNLNYGPTFDYLVSTRQRVSLWGIVPLSPEAYEAFLQRKATLEAGTLGYQVLDTIGEAGTLRNGVNCIHALADFAELLPHIPIAVQPYGDESAARIVAELERRGMPQVDAGTVEWLASALRLGRWPIRMGRAVLPAGGSLVVR